VNYRKQIRSGLETLSLEHSEQQLDQLDAYLALLHKWNRAYNLTAVRDPAQMVGRHLLDSLAIAPWLHGAHFADVGTGAGLPGIPLAIMRPDSRFELIDSNGKKIRFVTQAINELQLGNAHATQCRVEDHRPQQGYDAVTSRAFAALTDMAQGCSHMLAPDGVLLALKGIYPDDEIQALPAQYGIEASHALQVPGETGERHLIVIRPRRHSGPEQHVAGPSAAGKSAAE
jgi:16S rRNA (guanine527-N7)-methyltransferase